MIDVNSTVVSGTLTRDPFITQTANGTKKARFTLANNYIGYSGEDTNYLNFVAWGKLADYVERKLKEGDRIIVEGKNATNNYMKEDGTFFNEQNIVVMSIVPINLRQKERK